MTAIDLRPGQPRRRVPRWPPRYARSTPTSPSSVTGTPATPRCAKRYRLRPGAGGLPEGANLGWTTSFWPGMLWLAYELTGDETYLRAATAHVRSFADRVDGRHRRRHPRPRLPLHPVLRPAVARRTADRTARDAALAAADHLLTRVLEPAGIIQAWGDMSDPRQQGRTIIDSLMNTPLLFWASETSGDPRYAAAARRHVAQLRDHILRPDDTTFHTFYWDPLTGEPLRGETEQGNSDESCWARGQAWGIYGFALNHRHTGDESLLGASRRCADYFLAHLPADSVCLLGPGVLRRQRRAAGQLRRGHRGERPDRAGRRAAHRR